MPDFTRFTTLLWITATTIFFGCSSSLPTPTVIQIGDSIESARATLELWGGEGTYLSRYTVTIPAKESPHEGSVDSNFRVEVPIKYDQDSTRSSEMYPVVAPTPFPYDGYAFGNRTIVLHGDETVSDIEIVVSDGGGKSTEVSTFGHLRLSRAELLQ